MLFDFVFNTIECHQSPVHGRMLGLSGAVEGTRVECGGDGVPPRPPEDGHLPKAEPVVSSPGAPVAAEPKERSEPETPGRVHPKMFARAAVHQAPPWVLGETLPGPQELTVECGETDSKQMFSPLELLRLLSVPGVRRDRGSTPQGGGVRAEREGRDGGAVGLGRPLRRLSWAAEPRAPAVIQGRRGGFNQRRR